MVSSLSRYLLLLLNMLECKKPAGYRSAWQCHIQPEQQEGPARTMSTRGLENIGVTRASLLGRQWQTDSTSWGELIHHHNHHSAVSNPLLSGEAPPVLHRESPLLLMAIKLTKKSIPCFKIYALRSSFLPSKKRQHHGVCSNTSR